MMHHDISNIRYHSDPWYWQSKFLTHWPCTFPGGLPESIWEIWWLCFFQCSYCSHSRLGKAGKILSFKCLSRNDTNPSCCNINSPVVDFGIAQLGRAMSAFSAAWNIAWLKFLWCAVSESSHTAESLSMKCNKLYQLLAHCQHLTGLISYTYLTQLQQLHHSIELKIVQSHWQLPEPSHYQMPLYLLLSAQKLQVQHKLHATGPAKQHIIRVYMQSCIYHSMEAECCICICILPLPCSTGIHIIVVISIKDIFWAKYTACFPYWLHQPYKGINSCHAFIVLVQFGWQQAATALPFKHVVL